MSEYVEELVNNEKYKNKHLLKILIGVAWIDRIIQVEERDYLKYISEYHGLFNDMELQYFLLELKLNVLLIIRNVMRMKLDLGELL